MGSPATSSYQDNLLLSIFPFSFSSDFSPFLDWRTYSKCWAYLFSASLVTVLVSTIYCIWGWSLLASWPDATLMFWEGTILRKWALTFDEGLMVIFVLLFENSGVPNKLTSYFPSASPATILLVLFGNWTTRAPFCLLGTIPSV